MTKIPGLSETSDADVAAARTHTHTGKPKPPPLPGGEKKGPYPGKKRLQVFVDESVHVEIVSMCKRLGYTVVEWGEKVMLNGYDQLQQELIELNAQIKSTEGTEQ